MLDVTTVELTVLEAMLDGEVGCQARHERDGQICTVDVTHWLTHCETYGKPICLAAAIYALSAIAGEGVCSACLRSTGLCWKVIAI